MENNKSSDIENLINKLINYMSDKSQDLNYLILKAIIQDYSKLNSITPLTISSQLMNEFIDNKIEDKFNKKRNSNKEINNKVIENHKKVNEEEKLYTDTREVIDSYFERLIFSDFKKGNETDYIFYDSMKREIFIPFVISHKRNLPHRYAPQQTKI
jgi:hypothetical protein